MLWNLETGTHLGILAGHLGPVVDVSYSEDFALILSASADRTTRLWRAKTGEVVLSAEPRRRAPGRRAAQPGRVASAGGDGHRRGVGVGLARQGGLRVHGPEPPGPELV